MQLVWRLDVAAIRATACSNASQQKLIHLRSETVTPPLDGVAFRWLMELKWDADKGGSKVGLFAVPQNVPRDAFLTYSFSLSVPNRSSEHAGSTARDGTSPMQQGGGGRGCADFFDLGFMAGGWDESAWAAKGLPTSGQLHITLTVHGVSHTED